MEIQIETTNRCQCKCSFCIRPLDPPKEVGVMDNKIFERIVHNADEFNVSRFILTGLGDPFFDHDLVSRIKYIRKGFKKSIITIYTNGILATPEMVDECVSAGLNEIYFSLNAATPLMHERVMGIPGKLETVKANLRYSLGVDGLNTYISIVTGSQWLEPGEFDDIIASWPVDNVCGHTCGNWAGKIYKLQYLPQRNHCRWFKQSMYINMKGDVCLCCFDPYGKFSFGNVLESSLEDIWYGEKRKKFLSRLEESGRKSLTPCSGCTTI